MIFLEKGNRIFELQQAIKHPRQLCQVRGGEDFVAAGGESYGITMLIMEIVGVTAEENKFRYSEAA